MSEEIKVTYKPLQLKETIEMFRHLLRMTIKLDKGFNKLKKENSELNNLNKIMLKKVLELESTVRTLVK